MHLPGEQTRLEALPTQPQRYYNWRMQPNQADLADPQQDNPALSKVIERNIRTIIHLRTKAAHARSLHGRIADAITSFSGRMIFAYVHIVWFGIWILLNTGQFGVQAFDPFPYGLLTMIVSLEAIFLSTFVLISQNRLAEETERRADLDLHIGLLTEHELTRVLQMLDIIQDKLGIVDHANSELADLVRQAISGQMQHGVDAHKIGVNLVIPVVGNRTIINQTQHFLRHQFRVFPAPVVKTAKREHGHNRVLAAQIQGAADPVPRLLQRAQRPAGRPPRHPARRSAGAPSRLIGPRWRRNSRIRPLIVPALSVAPTRAKSKNWRSDSCSTSALHAFPAAHGGLRRTLRTTGMGAKAAKEKYGVPP